jgi:hypothetical protein
MTEDNRHICRQMHRFSADVLPSLLSQEVLGDVLQEPSMLLTKCAVRKRQLQLSIRRSYTLLQWDGYKVSTHCERPRVGAGGPTWTVSV